MKQYIPAFALALLVACSSGDDAPVDNGDNGDNGNNDPPPVSLPTQVEQAMEACGFDSLAIFLQTFEAFANAIQPPGVTTIFTVVGSDPQAGLFELELDLGPIEPPPSGPLSITDPETGLAPGSIDMAPFADSLDGLAAALTESTGDIEILLLLTAGEGAPSGNLLAFMTDGAVTAFEANAAVVGPQCALEVQAVDVPPTAFDGAYPDMSLDTVVNLEIGEETVRAETVFTFDGTAEASAVVTLEDLPSFTLLINLDTGAVSLAP